MADEEQLFCYKHPDRQTLLRCNKCGRPICPECSVRTPTGYRCKDCIREQQKVFDTAQPGDYPLGVLTALIPALLGSYAEGFIPLNTWLTGILLGMLIAALIQFLARKVHKGRRSQKLDLVMTAAAAIGALLPRLSLLIHLIELGFIPQALPMLIYPAVLVLSLHAERSGMIFRR